MADKLTEEFQTAVNDAVSQFLQTQTTATNPYLDALARYGFTGSETTKVSFGGDTVNILGLEFQLPQTAQRDMKISKSSGAILYAKGIIADPTTGEVFYDPKGKAPGSPQWLREEASKWDKEKVNSWRKKLLGLGYGEVVQGLGEKGPVDQTFLGALAEYHRSRYVNAGKVIPVATVRDRAKDAYDPILMRQDIRETVNTLYGRDASDPEIQGWEDRLQKIVSRQLKRGRTPEHAVLKAQETFAEELEETPEGIAASEQRETFEEKTRIRDYLFSIGELSNLVS